jgi:hypothetical protein
VEKSWKKFSEAGTGSQTSRGPDGTDIRWVPYCSATRKEASEPESVIRIAKILNARNVTGDAPGKI